MFGPIPLMIVWSALFTIGVVLFVRGWLGRRVGETPVCAACGYELPSREPGLPCPECASTAQKIGVRQRRWRLFAAGAVIMLIGGLGGGWSVANRIAPGTLAALKPVWLLRAELRTAGPGSPQAAAELERRRSAKLLTQSQIQAVADALLTIQSNPNAGWFNDYPTFLLGASASGDLSQSQMAQMVRQGVRLEPRVKPVIRAGSMAVFWTGFDQVRLGEKLPPTMMMNVRIESKAMEATFTPAAGNPIVVEVASGGRMQSGSLGGAMGSHRKVEVPPGEYEVALKSTLTISMLSMAEPIELRGQSRLKVKVVAPDEPMVELVTTPELEPQVRQAIRLNTVKKVPPDSIRLAIETGRTPVRLIGRIVAEQVDSEGKISRFPLSEVDARTETTDFTYSDQLMWPKAMRTVRTRFVFVPELELAELADGVTSMWANPIDLGEFDLASPSEGSP